MPSLPSLSHPETYRNTQARTGETIPLSALLLSVLTRREQQNRLPSLSPEQAARLYDDFLRGNLAEIQLAWEQMEDYDPTLSTCLHARQSALAEMSWRIEPDQTLLTENSTLKPLAEQQRKLLATRLRAVENLEDALVHLGTADFRGVAALEITGSPDRQKWCVIEPWHLLRPVRRGPWFFNPDAATTCPNPETLLQDRVIIRESRPIDLAAMFLVLSKTHALQGWDGFLDIYGLPSIFAELPPSIPAAQAAEFDAVVRRIVGDGRGTVPAGTKFQTVETTKDNAQAFEARAKWCDDAIIKLALGGLLTVQAESGSGTLAGSAHSDSFARLCASSAHSISRAVDTQYCRPILRRAFPGQPILVHFIFGDKQQEDHAANAALLATARTAGWQPDAATASTLLGFQASPAPEPSANPAQDLATNSVCNTAPEARSFGLSRRSRQAETEGPEPGLSPAELAAFQSLAASTLTPAAITTAAATAAAALEQAVAANADKDNECRAKDKTKCEVHGAFPHQWNPIQPAPKRCSTEKAIARLKQGIKLKDPSGHEVMLDSSALEHWKTSAKDTVDITNRLENLPVIEAVIQDPNEIWYNKKSRDYTYLAAVQDNSGRRYVVAFTTGNGSRINTYYPDSKRIGSNRTGKLIYSKDTKKEKASNE